MLVEGERRNILPYSFDAGKWIAGSGGTLTRDAGIAPDGTMTATKALSSSNDIDVNPNISGIDGSGGNITVSSSVTYTLSVWAKASTTAQIGNNFKVRMKRVSGSGFNPETTFALTPETDPVTISLTPKFNPLERLGSRYKIISAACGTPSVKVPASLTVAYLNGKLPSLT